MPEEYLQQPAVKVLGTDTSVYPPTPGQRVQQVTPNFDSPVLNQTIQQAGELSNLVSKSTQANAAIMKQSAEAYAQTTTLNATDSNNYGTSGWGELAKLATGMYSAYEAIQKEKAKAELARKKALREQYLPSFVKNIEELITNSDSILRGDGGYPEYHRLREGIVEQYKEYLDAEDLVYAYKATENPAQTLAAKFGSEMSEQVKKIETQVQSTKAQQLMFQLSPDLIRMSSDNGEVRGQASEAFFSKLQEAVKNLSYPAQVDIMDKVMAFGLKSVEKGTAAQAELQNSMENFRAAIELKREADQEFKACGNSADCINQYTDRIGFIKSKTGVSFQDNPLEAENRLASASSLYREMEQAKLQDLVIDDELKDINKAIIGDAALYLSNDPTAQAVLQAGTRIGRTGNNYPLVTTRIIELQKIIQQARKELPDLTLQQQRLQQSIATSGLTELQDILSWMAKTERDDAITKALAKTGVAASLGADITNQVTALMGIAPTKRTPEQQAKLDELQNRIRIQFNDVRKAMVSQVETISTQKEDLLRPLNQYNLLEDDGKGGVRIRTDPNAGMKSVNEIIKRVRQTVQMKTQPDMYQPSSVPSNFRYPQLKAVELGSGRTAILPFYPDANVTVSAGVQKPYTKVYTANWEHQHNPMPAAFDFTFEDSVGSVRVPLLSPVTGKVIETYVNNGRAGNGIVVEDSNTGIRYRVLHLDKPPTLRQGDAVTAGQTIIGIQGQTGDGVNTGNNEHVHLELYKNGWNMLERSEADKLARAWVDMHMNGGGRGKRLTVPERTPVVHNNFGTVLNMSRNEDGYWLEIKDGSGNITRYRGLGNVYVMKGAKLAPGQEIGRSNSQFQWEMFAKNGTPLDPFIFASQLPRNYRGSRNGQTTGKPPGAMQVNGGFIWRDSYVREDGRTVPLINPTRRTGYYNQHNPIIEGYASDNPKDYPKNNGTSNFGYAELARDKEFTRAIHRLADRIGFPAQWLADVMAFETGGTFSPAKTNPGTGATGLIQFMPETARLPALNTTTAELAMMTRAQQMRYVQKYLDEFKGRIKSPAHLLLAVWGGSGYFRDFERDPKSVQNVNDLYITFESYLNRLGEHAGRQYMHPYRRPRRVAIHTSYHKNCSKCQNLVASGSSIIPHEVAVNV